MPMSALIKSLEDTMRTDAGLNGDAQYIEQITWLIFLKAFDAKEMEWEFKPGYQGVIPKGYRWRDWAENPEGITGDELISFVNELFLTLKNLDVSNNDARKYVVRNVFSGVNNYMKSGTNLRKLVTKINEKVDFIDATKKHTFNDLYEGMLKDLQSAGRAGEFYTPRPVTNFVVEMVNPHIGESVLDPACGTGGFLTSTLNHMGKPENTKELELMQNNVTGWEKKPLPYLLSMTNLILHDIDTPRIINHNSLSRSVDDYTKRELVDVIVTNPPFGGSEDDLIKKNFPEDLRSSETADLFIILIMHLLKAKGRCGIVLPDGIMFGEGNQTKIKEKLVKEFGLHTIVRLPQVFKPYANVNTNLLFFQKGVASQGVWVYRYDMPVGYKSFSKTKPMLDEHLDVVREWWHDKKEILEDDGFKAKYFTADEIERLNYNFDKLCPFPKKQEEILGFHEFIAQYKEERAMHNAKIDRIIDDVCKLIGE